MKLLFILFLSFLNPPLNWSGDFSETTKIAKTSHKLILVNFSGSDWCGPCIRLRNEILESKEFNVYAPDKLLLVRADFPRQKKNKLPEDQVKRNEILAERYNKDGKFPYTLLLNEDGKILKVWDGYPNISAAIFIKEIDAFNQKK